MSKARTGSGHCLARQSRSRWPRRTPGWTRSPPPFGGQPDVGAHPESGVRAQPDDMLNVVDAVFAREGRKPSPYSARELAQAKSILERTGALVTGDDDGLAAELPFFDDTPAAAGGRGMALLQISRCAENPELGNGALLLLHLPINIEQGDAAALSHQLNAVESSELSTGCHFLGSWTAREGRPTFVSFLPAVAYRPGLLTNMALSMGMRGRFFAEFLRQA